MLITWLDIFKHITLWNIILSIFFAYLTNSTFHGYKVFIHKSENKSSIWNIKKYITKLPFGSRDLYRNGHKIMSIFLYFIAYTIFISSIDVLKLNQKNNQELIEN